MQLKIYNLEDDEPFLILDVEPETTIKEVKRLIHKETYLNRNRQSLRLNLTDRSLKDTIQLDELDFGDDEPSLYFRDLGPQVSYTMVFLLEYFGPLIIYFILYTRPVIPYFGNIYDHPEKPRSYVVHLAAACWSGHFAKRILETLFIHHFSHETMPLLNLFKNCAYYWGFAFFIGYFINHPLYTEPFYGNIQIVIFFIGFIFAECGNLSIHLLLRDLRPEGSTVRVVPEPNLNPLTDLFLLVSCPNYTYEVLSWFCFSVMSQSLPALIFTGIGLAQMSIWAIEKHKRYLKEFENYPSGRKAIIPFVL